MSTFWVIVIIFVIAVIATIIYQNKKRKEAIASIGVLKEDLIPSGKYTSGHPDIDKPIDKTELIVKDGYIKIYSVDSNTVPEYVTQISLEKVKTIVIEDASTLQKEELPLPDYLW